MNIRLNEVTDNATLKEVISQAIGELRIIVLNEMIATNDEQRRAELREQQDILEYESRVVLGDDEIARSVQDKALRLYSPMLKSYYGAN
ncbi:hypothetical protein [Porphyromonas levii]|uniref:Uncharacterized protein n=1 Tax=Porphyromonas levii TaxID=28114 RepID=A0A4Y8WPJ8_9PORP|nr:hypothetical protein [Porphyromonas levii]TFH94878.1 hypothetical protein E4P48_09445 [Porphyromonas levii]TFH95546.1 hypothetical protein E4P47_04265 [Porphyromonas levii]